MFGKIRVLCLVIILFTCATIPGITESGSLAPDNTELSEKEKFFEMVKSVAGIIPAAYKIFEREDDSGYDVLLYSSEFPSKLAWMGEKWQETAELICFYYEILAIMAQKDIAIYLTKDLRLLFTQEFIDEGYIKVYFEGQNVSFVHVSDGYVLLSRMNLGFKKKMDELNGVLRKITDLNTTGSAVYDMESDEVSIFFAEKKEINPYDDNVMAIVNDVAEILLTAERHLGIDVRVEQSFINCSFLVLREANDIIGYRTINDKEPEMFYSYLAYQLMKGK